MIARTLISRTFLSISTAALLVGPLAGCESLTRQQVGVGTGAVVGGVAGHAVTGGSTLGTVGGAAVGGVIGNEMSKR